MIIIHSFSVFPAAIPCAILMVIGIVMAAISITSILCSQDDKNINLSTTGMFLGIALIVFPLFIGCIEETRHQIIIDENTPFVEVQQKYEIIERRGISYIVKDIDT